MKDNTRPPPDSPATKAALLPARIAWWRSKGANAIADRLEAELAAIEAEAKAGEDA